MKKGSAVVQLTLEVKLADKWGADCKIQQLFKQAKDSATLRVGKMIGQDPNIHIRGKAKVTAILVEEE